MDIVEPLSTYFGEQGLEYRYIITVIDLCTRFVELIPLNNMKSEYVARKLDETWLCRFPKPSKMTTDQGFINKEFQELLSYYGITPCATIAYNPQANGVVERMHYYLKNCLRCSENQNWEDELQGVAWSIRLRTTTQ